MLTDASVIHIVRACWRVSRPTGLNAWFRVIVEHGTGKSFTQADNADWPAITCPILEALFRPRRRDTRLKNLCNPAEAGSPRRRYA